MSVLETIFQKFDVSDIIVLILAFSLFLFGGLYILFKKVLKDVELTLPNGMKFKGSSKETSIPKEKQITDKSEKKDTEATFNMLKSHYHIIRRIGVDIIKIHIKNIAYITYYTLNHQSLPNKSEWLDRVLRGYYYIFKKTFDSIDYIHDVDFSNFKLFVEILQKNGIDLYSNYLSLYSRFEDALPKIVDIFNKETNNASMILDKSKECDTEKTLKLLDEIRQSYHKKAYKYLTDQIDKRAYEILFYLITKIEKYLKDYLDGTIR